MANSNLRLVSPADDLRTVELRRRSNSEMGRDREHLTELEVERLTVGSARRDDDLDRLPAWPAGV